MGESMSARHLAEIRERATYSAERSLDVTINTLVSVDVPDLLAEVDRLRERDDRIHEELRDRRTDDLNVRGHLSPQPGTGPHPMIPFELGPTLAPAVEWLVGVLAQVRATHEQMLDGDLEPFDAMAQTGRILEGEES